MFNTIKSWFTPKASYTVGLSALRMPDNLQAGDKAILLVTIGNDIYPTLDSSIVEKVEHRFRQALTNAGVGSEVQVVTWNHAIKAEVIVVERAKSSGCTSCTGKCEKETGVTPRTWSASDQNATISASAKQKPL